MTQVLSGTGPKEVVFSSTKLNSREVGGKDHHIFDHTSDSVPIPSTKVNCKHIGGVTHDIFGVESHPVSEIPSTKINSRHVGGKDHIFESEASAQHEPSTHDLSK